MNEMSKRTALRQLKACIKIDTLEPAQARVLVAKDVLALLKIEKLNGVGGTYVKMDFPKGYTVGDLRSQMPGMTTATVCGIGALFVAHVARFDKLKIEAVFFEESLSFTQIEIHSHLAGVFPFRMLAHIEGAYEAGPKDGEFLLEWAERYEFGPKRMVAIMKNIIRNGGDFDITDVG